MYFDDMAESIEKTLRYTKGMTPEQFFADRKTVDSVCFNLAILGEAANKVTPEVTFPRCGDGYKQGDGCRKTV